MYGYDREENILTKYMVEGVVKDKNSDKLLPGATVTLLDDRGNTLQELVTSTNADYLFKLEPNKKYTVRGYIKRLYTSRNRVFYRCSGRY